MKALVTGATGFIGSHLVESLVARQWSVRCLVRGNGNGPWLQGLPVERCRGDCRDPGSLSKAVQDVEVVFHLAGTTKALHPRTFFEVNAVGTDNILRACAELNPGIRAFIYVSSQSAAGPSGHSASTGTDGRMPVSAYGQSKRRGEELALMWSDKVPVAVIRSPVVYGPRDRGLLPLFRLASWGMQPRLGGRDQRLSFCYVEDLTRGLILASAKKEALGHTFFLSDGRDYGWKEINQAFATAAGRRTLEFPVHPFLIGAYAAMRDVVAALLRRPGVISRSKVKEMVQSNWVCDSANSQRVLGFDPAISLTEGVKLTFEWYKGAKWL